MQPLDESIIEKENVTVKYGAFWPRLGALLIDGIALAPISFGLTYFNIVSWKSAAAMVLINIAGIAYKPFMEYNYGATLGKMALRLKVTNLQLEPADLQTILIRNSLQIVPNLIIAFFTFGMYNDPDFEAISSYSEYTEFSRQFVAIQTVSLLSGLIVIIEAIMVAADDQKRALHDRMAGTFVIEKP